MKNLFLFLILTPENMSFQVNIWQILSFIKNLYNFNLSALEFSSTRFVGKYFGDFHSLCLQKGRQTNSMLMKRLSAEVLCRCVKAALSRLDWSFSHELIHCEGSGLHREGCPKRRSLRENGKSFLPDQRQSDVFPTEGAKVCTWKTLCSF